MFLRGLTAPGTGRLGHNGDIERDAGRFTEFTPMRECTPQHALLTEQQKRGQQASQSTRIEEG